ncbi:hypothetical protein PHMEG_0009386 [Phytophthora megakarya]|uniref:Helitron helicase n=1 Tax=Phytophthora megakarya TaxID=4795 RepID=A0A225WIT9_9STRA|nr:hypothetical protein PHMEG_0009386 [Phytophthora megakarya]
MKAGVCLRSMLRVFLVKNSILMLVVLRAKPSSRMPNRQEICSDTYLNVPVLMSSRERDGLHTMTNDDGRRRRSCLFLANLHEIPLRGHRLSPSVYSAYRNVPQHLLAPEKQRELHLTNLSNRGKKIIFRVRNRFCKKCSIISYLLGTNYPGDYYVPHTIEKRNEG